MFYDNRWKDAFKHQKCNIFFVKKIWLNFFSVDPNSTYSLDVSKKSKETFFYFFLSLLINFISLFK